MSTAIILTAYKDNQLKTNTISYLLFIRHADLDKFVLQTFNKLVYE